MAHGSPSVVGVAGVAPGAGVVVAGGSVGTTGAGVVGVVAPVAEVGSLGDDLVVLSQDAAYVGVG